MKIKATAFLFSLIFVGSLQAQTVVIPPFPQGDWEVLFDGEKVQGMRGYRRTGFPDNCWKIEGGILKTIPGASDLADLVTIKNYKDFQLEFQWAAVEGSNSGVLYRVTETRNPIWHTGPEYQLLDDNGQKKGKPIGFSGSLYTLKAPNIDKTLAPLKEFNSGKIVCKDGQVEHWLNGMIIVSYEWGSEEIKEQIRKSKFKSMPQFMQFEKGHIGFQHHGQEIWLKNIRITAL